MGKCDFCNERDGLFEIGASSCCACYPDKEYLKEFYPKSIAEEEAEYGSIEVKEQDKKEVNKLQLNGEPIYLLGGMTGQEGFQLGIKEGRKGYIKEDKAVEVVAECIYYASNKTNYSNPFWEDLDESVKKECREIARLELGINQ